MANNLIGKGMTAGRRSKMSRGTTVEHAIAKSGIIGILFGRGTIVFHFASRTAGVMSTQGPFH